MSCEGASIVKPKYVEIHPVSRFVGSPVVGIGRGLEFFLSPSVENGKRSGWIKLQI
jgi:hypothetical protein